MKNYIYAVHELYPTFCMNFSKNKVSRPYPAFRQIYPKRATSQKLSSVKQISF